MTGSPHSLARYMDKYKLKQESKAFQLLSKLLHMDPKKRLNAQSALDDTYFQEVLQCNNSVYKIPTPI